MLAVSSCLGVSLHAHICWPSQPHGLLSLSQAMAGMSEPQVGAEDQVGGVLLPVVLPVLSSLVSLLLSWLPVTTPVLSSVLPWVF